MAFAFYIKTFGCQMNERDSEIIAQSLARHDYIETMEMDSADLIILNTCSIRAKAEQKVLSLLGYLRRNKKRNPSLKICVAGCVAQQLGESIIERMPHVDVVIGTQHIHALPGLLEKSENVSKVYTSLSAEYDIPPFIAKADENLQNKHTSIDKNRALSRFVTIMQGCNNYCTYCVVPYTRGREVSRKFNDIIEEVKALVGKDVEEFTLLGQNVNSYGQTNNVREDGTPCSFPQLLRSVAAIQGVKRVRFTTSNPKDLSHDLMRCFRDLDNLCPHFHLPVQAGSNDVLKRMNRKYTVEKYKELVVALRQYCPAIVLTTDIIVGFPGETEDDFEKTMDLLETVQFDGSFSFKYSDRPGTASLNLENKVPEEEKSDRLGRYQKRQNEISLKRNSSYIGKIVNVIVEEIERPTTGQYSYKCRALTNHVVHTHSNAEFFTGQNLHIEIQQAGQHSLKGQIIDIPKK